MTNEKIMYLYDFLLILQYKEFVLTFPDERILQDIYPKRSILRHARCAYDESQDDYLYLEIVNEVPCLIIDSPIDQRILFFHPDYEQMATATPVKIFINHKDGFWNNRYVKYHREKRKWSYYS